MRWIAINILASTVFMSCESKKPELAQPIPHDPGNQGVSLKQDLVIAIPDKPVMSDQERLQAQLTGIFVSLQPEGNINQAPCTDPSSIEKVKSWQSVDRNTLVLDGIQPECMYRLTIEIGQSKEASAPVSLVSYQLVNTDVDALLESKCAGSLLGCHEQGSGKEALITDPKRNWDVVQVANGVHRELSMSLNAVDRGMIKDAAEGKKSDPSPSDPPKPGPSPSEPPKPDPIEPTIDPKDQGSGQLYQAYYIAIEKISVTQLKEGKVIYPKYQLSKYGIEAGYNSIQTTP